MFVCIALIYSVQVVCRIELIFFLFRLGHGFSAMKHPNKSNAKQKRIKQNLDKFFAIRIEQVEEDGEEELCLIARSREGKTI